MHFVPAPLAQPERTADNDMLGFGPRGLVAALPGGLDCLARNRTEPIHSNQLQEKRSGRAQIDLKCEIVKRADAKFVGAALAHVTSSAFLT